MPSISEFLFSTLYKYFSRILMIDFFILSYFLVTPEKLDFFEHFCILSAYLTQQLWDSVFLKSMAVGLHFILL